MSNSNELVQHPGSLPVLNGYNQLPSKIEKQTRQGTAQAQARAIVAATQVQAAAFVTHTALTQAAMLSAEEAALSAADPIAAARYESIVNDFVFVARNTIRRMGQ